VDVRLIAATNRNLQSDVDGRRFRGDLYFRLNVVELHVPPLRERPDDLRGLAAMLQTRIATRMHRAIGGYTDAALNCLLQYAWPGNVRELENAIERACALATGLLIDVDDLPNTLRTCPSLVGASPEVRPLHDVEREYILSVLQRNGGNKLHTAEQLRINTTTLFRKLKRYELTCRLSRVCRPGGTPLSLLPQRRSSAPSSAGTPRPWPHGRLHPVHSRYLMSARWLRHRSAVVRCTITPQRSPAASRRASTNRWHAR
jgi:hypothetical protein